MTQCHYQGLAATMASNTQTALVRKRLGAYCNGIEECDQVMPFECHIVLLLYHDRPRQSKGHH